MLLRNEYNPDVLSCLANLSSDEVFTPPRLANEMLDLLPKELWSDKYATFLDPVCKTGVFLREIAKRLLKGLEKEIPDLEKRIDHIFKNQLYGIAITELTALMSRRTVYCSKHANGEKSVVNFDNEDGNIHYSRQEHTWKNGKCSFCGASQEEYDRESHLETHAYQLIHTEKPEEIFSMKFNVIIGNPPYQLSDAGDSTGSSPIYHLFVNQAKKMNPDNLVMIIPSRWFAGGKGLDTFRSEMLKDNRLSHLIDYPVASDAFGKAVQINGGVCYFEWQKNYKGDCEVTTIMSGRKDTMSRALNQYDIFVRFNRAVPILEKVKKKGYPPMSSQVSTQKPFGLRTFVKPGKTGSITLYANGGVGKIAKAEITTGLELLDKWKVITSMGYGEGGESREYPRMITGKPIIAPPQSACTETYIVVGVYDSEEEAQNLDNFLRTKFARFLIALRKNTQHITRDRFQFVPKLPMTQKWTDEKLVKHFGLTEDDVAFIAEIVKPMDSNLF